MTKKINVQLVYIQKREYKLQTIIQAQFQNIFLSLQDQKRVKSAFI